MEAKELRIGNYVLEKGRLVRIHDGFGIDHAHNFGPIPLTPEWMERLGFKDVVSRYLRLYVIGGCYLEWDKIDNELWLTLGLSDDTNSVQLEHIKFVHQLQNLYFALTGKELEVK